ncbi:MAG: DUF4159 domain-containing protein [Candidatus Brocadiia bacterium]
MEKIGVMLSLAVIIFAPLFALGAAGGGRGIPKGPCGSAEPANQQRRKSGEGIPPLPLPATPQRRTERKRQPSPPPLVAKIQFGSVKEVKHSGKVVKYHDWNKDPGDVPVLLNKVHKQLNVRYAYKRGPLSSFAPDAAQYPVFYFTGSDPFRLNEAQIKHLREFVRSGGIIWADCCFGDPEFFGSFVQNMEKVMNRHFRRLKLSHPLFNSFYEMQQVKYTRDDVPEAPEPVFYGVDVGCRTAIILSRYDLSCGWDGHIREGSMAVHPTDARKLGINMVAYALGTHRVGQYQAVQKQFFETQKRSRGDFVFAQAKLDENWNTQHNAIANLLKTVAKDSSATVKFDHKGVELAKNELQNYPFVYMSGHHDFVLSETEVASLKRYIRNGGFILASPCCGSPEFDKAFRREIKKVLPGNKLKSLSESHPVYSILHEVDAIQYNEYVRNTGDIGPALPLEGIQIGASTPVMYCPYGIGGGWRGFDHPFARDIATKDALNLGGNVVVYSMTH